MGGETLEMELNNCVVEAKNYAVLDGCYIWRGGCGSCCLIIVTILFRIDLAVFTTAVQG